MFPPAGSESSGYWENGYGFVRDGDTVISVDRLDAGWVPTLDAPPPSPRPPERGWPEGTRIIGGRAVMPHDPARRAPFTPTASLAPPPGRRSRRAPRARQSRSRRARRASGSSRGSPSDEPGGDGEPAPSPGRSEGSSNSQHGDGFFGSWCVEKYGIDTVRYGFRDAGPAAAAHFLALPTRRLTRRERGSSNWATQLVRGFRLGYWPSADLFVAEGRLGPVLSRSAVPGELALADALVPGAQEACRAFADLGVDVGGKVGIRRLDLATDVVFAEPQDGLLLLRALRALQLAGVSQHWDRNANGGETVWWRFAEGIVLRVYDAGVEHGTHGPGQRLRLEREALFRKSREMAPEQFDAARRASLVLGPLARIVEAAPSVAVLSPRQAELLVLRRQKDEGLGPAITAGLLGQVRAFELGVASEVFGGRDGVNRKLRELRGHGIVLDLDQAPSEVRSLDVGAVLRALGSLWEGAS